MSPQSGDSLGNPTWSEATGGDTKYYHYYTSAKRWLYHIKLGKND